MLFLECTDIWDEINLFQLFTFKMELAWKVRYLNVVVSHRISSHLSSPVPACDIILACIYCQRLEIGIPLCEEKHHNSEDG